MNNMKLSEKFNELFKSAYELGIEEIEVFVQTSEDFSVKIYEKEIDKYSLSEEFGISVRGKYNNKMGYAYSEKFEEDDIQLLVKSVQENALIIDSEDEYEIYGGSEEYKEIETYNSSLDQVNQQEKIDLAKELELEIYRIDSRVKKVNYSLYGEGNGETILKNTKGLELKEKSNMAYLYASVIIEDGDGSKTASKHQINNDFSKFDYKKLAKDVVNEGVSKIGSKPVSTGSYEIILRNDAMGDLFSTFLSNFSAENVQKDLSALKGKIGELIASEKITLIDNPHMINGIASKAYDGEGVATKSKKIIENGVLKTYFHNLKTAKKDGIKTTGNAYKSSYKGTLGIAPSNLYIQSGDLKLEEMISEVKNGLVITDLSGLHSGVNSLSGQFSLLAEGFYFENGDIVHPVNQITIAGNFYDLIKDIKIIGSDLEFGMPSGGSWIGTPSIAIGKLMVAGE